MIIYSGFTIRKMHVTRFAVWVSLSLLALMYAVAHAGEHNSTSQGIAWVSLILILIFASLATRYFYRKRFRIKMEMINGKLKIEINDPLLPAPLILENNYFLQKQALHEQNIKGVVMQTFYLKVRNEKGELLVIFSASKFFFQKRMDGFEFIDTSKTGEEDKLTQAPLIYSFVVLDELDKILSRYEKA